ncbi:MAG: hypothetical protein EBV30_09880 [Actinobacteria bacterium]|nr:hypothetical protein [Actinomycetota bacterium]NBO56099.1 hypothetical protein [Actinomycetota bacterium]
MVKKIQKITRAGEKKAQPAAKSKKVEKAARTNEKKPFLAKLKRLGRWKSLKVFNTLGAHSNDFVPFSLGALSGATVFVFVGIFAGKHLSGPACMAEAKVEAAKTICQNLVDRAVSERCDGLKKKDAEECKAYIEAQAAPACSDLVELELLEAQAAETCKK